MCVTAATAGASTIKAETIILGRPLSDPPPGSSDAVTAVAAGGGASKSFALLFINNRQKSSTVVCNSACLTKLGAPSGSSFKVTDVVTGKAHHTARYKTPPHTTPHYHTFRPTN